MSRCTVAAFVLVIGLIGTIPASAQRQPANGAGFVPNGWCKGNGNPHAAQCPIFAPGSTAPNTHTNHQQVPTANQLPQQPQPPTIPTIPLTTLTPAQLVPPRPTIAVPQRPTIVEPPKQAIVAPPMKPGFVAYPDHTGPRDPNTGYPVVTANPPQTITGYSPYMVPPQPTIAVPQRPTIVEPPKQAIVAPPMKPGFVAYPDYVGPRDPNTGYPIVTANPPQTITGYSPYMVPPQPTITEPPKATVVEPPKQAIVAPPMKPGFVAYPDHTGPRDPNTGYPVVTANPPQTITGYSPYMVPPQPQLPQGPQGVPQTRPNNVPTPMQVEVPRPRPLPPQVGQQPTSQANVVITPQGGGSHVGAELIAAKPGRQAANAVPVFEAKGTGDRWHCVASGHHVRKIFDDTGNEVYAGSLPGVAIQVVPIIRDIPAWHDLSTECIISVREHPKARQARR